MLRRVFVLICVTYALAASASAVLVDWSTLSWAAGSLSNSYDVDPSNPGNDVTVTVSGDTGQLLPEPPQTPAITTNLQGGQAFAASTLTLLVDFSNQSQGVTVTVDFSALYAAGVTNVSFQLFDVDFASSPGNSGSNYQDQIRSISALSIDGTTLIAPTITISPNNSLTGTGLSQVVNGTASLNDTGAGSGDANVTISFGTAAIKSFTFTYGSGSDTNSDPTLEHIGLYNIDYIVLPEPGALGVCVAIISLAIWTSHRRLRGFWKNIIP